MKRTKKYETRSSAVTFCSFHAMASSLMYYSTYAQQNEIYWFYISKEIKIALKKLCFVVACVTSSVIYTLYNTARTRTNEITLFI